MPCITSFWNYLGFENRNRSLSLIFYRVQTGSDFVFDLVSGWCAIGMFYNCRFCKQIVVLWEAYFVAIFAANTFILFLSTIIAFLLMGVTFVYFNMLHIWYIISFANLSWSLWLQFQVMILDFLLNLSSY